MSFVTDLVLIRESHNLTRDDIHKITKLSSATILSIENGTAIRNYYSNETYTRSFIRAYAKAIKIDDADIIKAIDAAISNQYRSTILEKYLPEKAKRSIEENKLEREQKSEDITETLIAESSNSELPPQPEQTEYNKAETPPEINAIDWAQIGKNSLSNPNLSKIIISIIVVIAVVGTVYWLLTRDFDSDDAEVLLSEMEQVDNNEPAQNEVTIVPDTTITSEPNQEQIQPEVETASNTTFGDTITVIIYAEKGKLEPVRVRTDLSNSYFPYWIEEKAAMKFRFKDSVQIRGQFLRMNLLINDVTIPNFRNFRGSNNEVLLTRDLLNQNTNWFTTPLDTSFVLPDTILDRPTF